MDARKLWRHTGWPLNTIAIEVPVCLLVMGLLVSVAFSGYPRTQRHLQVLHALSLMQGARVAAMEYRAVSGTWPDSNAQAGLSDSPVRTGLGPVNSILLRPGGAVDVGFFRAPLKGGLVSFRAWTIPGAGLPVTWTCARAPSAPGRLAAEDRTNLADPELPSPCRAHP
jgi:type IV pilus assembly protein PilA